MTLPLRGNGVTGGQFTANYPSLTVPILDNFPQTILTLDNCKFLVEGVIWMELSRVVTVKPKIVTEGVSQWRLVR